jgi:uncharacterized membrane protein (UPF0127 family)
MAAQLTAINLTRGTTLSGPGRIADNAWTRLVGLLRDKSLAEGDGLWITPCNSIHSFGMRFIFDAVFLDRDLRVVHLVRRMKPWRISKVVFAAKSVLELPPGVIDASATEIGDQFDLRRG